MSKNKLILGDCLEKLKELESNSVDTIITDPPYGLSFMGKKWDYDVPSIDVWKECLRVLKPGGTALIFAGSRTQHRMAVAVEDAGFILKDCIMWLYGSGFPKATDISKQLDKGHKREIVGKKSYTTPKADNSIQANSYGISGGSLKAGQKADRLQEDITIPTTPDAKLWNGWKSHGLKPAYEPIIVAMKPNDGSYAENALKHGVSGLNIDGGRIPIDKDKETDCRVGTDRVRGDKEGLDSKSIFGCTEKGVQMYKDGRFPANILFDEEAAKMLDEQSGVSKSSIGKNVTRKKRSSDGVFDDKNNGLQDGSTELEGYKDKGGASRFFYVAKASKAERNMGCEELKKQFAPKGNNEGRDMDNPKNHLGGMQSSKMRNHHPTVKPLKLMEYLCTLTKTPTGGIVLDPFMGSGTTGMACKNTCREFIGIEKESEYFEIAKKRINNTMDSLF